jgi:hypothetical protein
MRNILLLLVLAVIPTSLISQEITWENVSSNYEFPEGLELFYGTISGNNSFFAYYYKVDMDEPQIAIRPYIAANPQQVAEFTESVGAYGAVNGGFFAGTSSVSSVVYPNEVLARNITALTRFSKTYPVIRSIFALNNDRSLSTEWVYHHSALFDDIYVYDAPLPYIENDPTPQPVPIKVNGSPYEEIAYGLGGGPMLVKDGQITFTWDEEIFWGSGVDQGVDRPRTAVGYTIDNKVIIFVTNSMKIEDLPQLMLDLGCHGAMNLDGGGSTAMAAGGTSIYDQNRPVPTILAIVHSDSLGLPKTPTYEKFIDTSDDGVTSSGSWFATANEGFFGDPSMLHALGTNNEFYSFPLNLPTPGEYEIYGWWTSHGNRAADTPFYITHAGGEDEVRVNQSIGGSFWNLIGKWQFHGSPDEAVKITAAASTNSYVVADAIRVVSYEDIQIIVTIISINPVDDITVPYATSLNDALAMLPQETTIVDSEENSHTVALSWQVDSYDPETAGDYLATANFELPEGVEQTNPPTLLQVSALITVEEIDDTSVYTAEKMELQLYPNPGVGFFTLKAKIPGKHRIIVLSAEGKVVFQTAISGNINREIDLSGLEKGLYFLRLTGPVGNTTKKLIIQ